jgi:hypothetical protein
LMNGPLQACWIIYEEKPRGFMVRLGVHIRRSRVRRMRWNEGVQVGGLSLLS